MTLALTIDQAAAGDAEALAMILTDWIGQTPWMPELHSRSETVAFLSGLVETANVSAARLDGVPCGFLALDGSEVPALYLAPAARGRGIGRALLDQAKAQSGNLALWTFQANTGARRFYAREGFREVKRTDGARNEENLPDVRCVWSKTEDARG